MSDTERYCTLGDDGNGDGPNWGIEIDGGKVILRGLVSHDACDAVMAELDERDDEIARLKAEAETLKLGSLLTASDVWVFLRIKAEVERLRENNAKTVENLRVLEKAWTKYQEGFHERPDWKGDGTEEWQARTTVGGWIAFALKNAPLQEGGQP